MADTLDRAAQAARFFCALKVCRKLYDRMRVNADREKNVQDSPDFQGRELTPGIISASRSTDIPAFYAEWFMRRLREGYVRWRNPFNQQDFRIDLRAAGGIVFWTKNAKPLLPYLEEIHDRGYDFYFQFTVNDYEAEGYEPRVPPLAERIETFAALSRRWGSERVVWRYDPICLAEGLDADGVMERIRRVGDALAPYTRQLVFSFVDVGAYAKVQRNVKRQQELLLREPSFDEQDRLGEMIAAYAASRQLTPATCGERRSFARYGIDPNKCVDGDLFARICRPGNVKLQRHLGIRLDQHVLGVPQRLETLLRKDKGQRTECGCVESKDIGMYNTCGHMCVYCYANTSVAVVEKNRARHQLDADGIIPLPERGETPEGDV